MSIKYHWHLLPQDPAHFFATKDIILYLEAYPEQSQVQMRDYVKDLNTVIFTGLISCEKNNVGCKFDRKRIQQTFWLDHHLPNTSTEWDIMLKYGSDTMTRFVWSNQKTNSINE